VSGVARVLMCAHPRFIISRCSHVMCCSMDFDDFDIIGADEETDLREDQQPPEEMKNMLPKPNKRPQTGDLQLQAPAKRASIEIAPSSTASPSPPASKASEELPMAKLQSLLHRILSHAGDDYLVCKFPESAADDRGKIILVMEFRAPGMCLNGKTYDHKYELTILTIDREPETPVVSYNCILDDDKVLKLHGDAIDTLNELLVLHDDGEFDEQTSTLRRVRDFNKRHFVCYDGEKYATVKTNGDVKLQTRQHFIQNHESLPPVIEQRGRKTVEIPFTTIWMKHPRRRTMQGVQCIPPPCKCPPGVYNSWNGFVADKFAGQFEYNEDVIKPILYHIREVIAAGDEVYNDFVLDFNAHMIQFPGLVARIGLITTGERGCGKTMIVVWIGEKIIGPDKFVSTELISKVMGQFKLMRSGKLLLNMDELKAKDGKQYCEEMKRSITESTVLIEGKGRDPVPEHNCMRSWTTTNYEDSVHVSAGEDERRWVTKQASNKHRGDTEYTNTVLACMDQPEAQWSFIEYLRRRDLTNVNLERDRPKTEEYVRNQQANIPGHVQVMHLISWLPSDSDAKEMPYVISISSDTLFELYKRCIDEWFSGKGAEAKSASSNAFGRMMSSFVQEGTSGKDEASRLFSGVEKHRTKKERGFVFDRKKLAAFLQNKYNVDEDAYYLQASKKYKLYLRVGENPVALELV
jgi:Family of unknown function (DUF5906)